MTTAKIYGAGSYLPKESVATTDLCSEANIFPNNIVKEELGIHHVRHEKAGVKPSVLAIRSAESAIQNAGISASQIDTVIYCGIEGDYCEPSTAHIIAGELSINAGRCFDVSNACLGFASGIDVAESYIKLHKSTFVLVVTAEVASKGTLKVIDNLKKKLIDKDRPNSYLGAFTVGDGGGAMILGPNEEGKGLKYIRTETDASLNKLCYYEYIADRLVFNMQMAKISVKTLKICEAMMEDTYSTLGWSPDSIDVMIPHQVGNRPFHKLLEISGIPENKSIATYPYLGNLASATLPVCYDMLQKSDRLQPGMQLLIMNSGSGASVTHLGISL